MGIYNVDFKKFNEDFFKNAKRKTDKIKYFDKTIVRTVSKDVVAEISLVTTGVQGSYTSYNVRIMNKNFGLLAEHLFRFGDYFLEENRIDCRPDYDGIPHINTTTCKRDGIADWYIIIPAPFEIDSMAKRILEYIDLYK